MHLLARDGLLFTSRIVLMVIAISGVSVACSKRTTHLPAMARLIKASTQSPQSAGATSESSPSPPQSDSAPPKTPRAPRDPLLDDSVDVDCGPPRDNPYGYEWGVTSADGTCQTCERPPLTLPHCNPAIRAQDVTQSTLKVNVGKKVRFYGVVDFPWVNCTKMGGPCACPNRCGAPLRLRHRRIAMTPLPSKQERINQRNAILNGTYKEPNDPQERKHSESNSSYVLLALGGLGTNPGLISKLREYASDEGVLTCNGDENSICCPFALDRDTLKVRVVAGGLLLAGPPQWMPDSTTEYRLLVQDLCRVAD